MTRPQVHRVPQFKHARAIAGKMREVLEHMEDHERRAALIRAGLRAATIRGYLAVLERLDAVAREAGFPEGMRTLEAFVAFLLAHVECGLAKGNSSVTHMRSALQWRQEEEGVERWAASQVAKRLVNSHDSAGKRANTERLEAGGAPEVTRGAVTHNLVTRMAEHMPDAAQLILWLQYECALRPHEIFTLSCNCLTEDKNGSPVLAIPTNKAMNVSNASTVSATQRRPLSEAGLAALRRAITAASKAGRTGGKRALFDMTHRQYDAAFARAVDEAALATEHPGLEFVPHGVRHGRVSDLVAHAAAEKRDVSDFELKQVGMSRAVASRFYGLTNDDRLHRARSGKKVVANTRAHSSLAGALRRQRIIDAARDISHSQASVDESTDTGVSNGEAGNASSAECSNEKEEEEEAEVEHGSDDRRDSDDDAPRVDDSRSGDAPEGSQGIGAAPADHAAPRLTEPGAQPDDDDLLLTAGTPASLLLQSTQELVTSLVRTKNTQEAIDQLPGELRPLVECVEWVCVEAVTQVLQRFVSEREATLEKGFASLRRETAALEFTQRWNTEIISALMGLPEGAGEAKDMVRTLNARARAQSRRGSGSQAHSDDETQRPPFAVAHPASRLPSPLASTPPPVPPPPSVTARHGKRTLTPPASSARNATARNARVRESSVITVSSGSTTDDGDVEIDVIRYVPARRKAAAVTTAVREATKSKGPRRSTAQVKDEHEADDEFDDFIDFHQSQRASQQAKEKKAKKSVKRVTWSSQV
jgi:integrase